jgi:hypothetical protein
MAQISTKDFLDLYPHQSTDIYIIAMYNGMEWYRLAAVEAGHGKGLYCPPYRMAMTHSQAVSIIRQHLSGRAPTSPQSPVALALLKAMIEAFPCGR